VFQNKISRTHEMCSGKIFSKQDFFSTFSFSFSSMMVMVQPRP